MLLNAMPLAQTPQSKVGAREMRKYAQRIHGMIDGLTPWRDVRGNAKKQSNLSREALIRQYGLKPGEVIIVDDGGAIPRELAEGIRRVKDGKN